MRIAFVQKNFHPNSVGLIRGLQERGHIVLNVIQYYRLPPDQDEVDVTSVVIPYGRVSLAMHSRSKKRLDRRALPRLWVLSREFRKFRPDVVIVKETRAAALVAGLVGRLLGAKVVLMCDKPLPFRKIPWLATVGRLFLPRIKFHMGHRGEIGEDVDLGGLAGRSRLLPYPVSPNPSVTPRATGAARTRIVAVGSLNSRRKRMTWSTEAVVAAGLSEDVDITYVGLGTETSFSFREIRETEQRHGISPATILLGLPHSEVMELLPTFDLFVHPARNEPFGAVVPEAMAAGLPVICSSTCGSRVCFENGLSGLIFASDSFEEFTRAVERLVRDSELRNTMGVAAYRRVEDHLHPVRWAEMFEDLVEGRVSG